MDLLMWKKGTLCIPQDDGTSVVVRYNVKVYDKPSKFGIDGGRISKLWLCIEDMTVANYDRGWDMEPESEAAQMAYMYLIFAYN